jgi:Type IX secretion system protein PorV
MRKPLSKIIVVAFFALGVSTALAQIPDPKPTIGQVNEGRIPIPAVLFLNISPDARSAAMADAGVALSPSAYSIFWNPAQTAFATQTFEGALSYTPWLRNLGIDDMALLNVSGYHRFKKNQAIGIFVNYFNQGSFQNTSSTGQLLGNFNSREYAITASYSRKLSDNFSMGVNLKYINSDIFGGLVISGVSSRPATTVAADLGLYGRINRAGRSWSHAYGLSISNISGKISYGGSEENFIPTNLKLGWASTNQIDAHNKFTITADFNKLMVPTPVGDWRNKGAFAGIFGSFGDAPDGASEELKEINTSIGMEYLYRDAFAIRAGYFFESQMKGNRKYLTAGIGFKVDKKIGFDFAYLIPTTEQSPLANTLRFTISAALDKKTAPSDLNE